MEIRLSILATEHQVQRHGAVDLRIRIVAVGQMLSLSRRLWEPRLSQQIAFHLLLL